ncbi:Uncharacterised protein [uncultured archaeon]|nr:Uncharacterised protein [uncultured archaeon]
MELFKISNGPWERLFTGAFQGHEVELYSNPDRILMVLIYEKKLDKTEGAIAELYKVFHALGDVESFTETLPREALILTKHDENSTMKFLLLGSKPAYVRWVEEEFIRDIDSLVKRLEAAAVLIKDVSKAYDLSLEEISESPEEVRKAFFTMPMLPPLLATSYHPVPGAEADASVQKQQSIKGEIVLGITRDGQRVSESLSLFTKAVAGEGEKPDRARLITVLAESALLSNTPVIFFDFSKQFAGIGEANRNLPDIQKYKVEIDPLGFPFKQFKVRESIHIDLNMIGMEALAEEFGIGDKDFPHIVKTVLDKEKSQSIEQLIERVSRTPPTEEYSEFEILKAARLLKLISVRYQLLFGGENDIEEMARQGTASIARAAILDFENIDPRGVALLCNSLLKEMLEYYKNKGPTELIRTFLVFPSPQAFQPKDRQKIISAENQGILNELPKYGVSFIIGAEHITDVDAAIRDQSDAILNIVSGNDISVQLKNRKAYRALVRPTLSRPY